MKPASPVSEFALWRSEKLFNIDFASYTLNHHSFPRHFHDHYVIELVIKGADKFYCDGKTYTAVNEQLVLINPGEVHTGSTLNDEALHYFSLCPTPSALQQIADSLEKTVPADLIFNQSLLYQPVLAGKLKQLYYSFQQPDEALKQEELFIEFMSGLFELAVNKNSSNPVSSYRDDARIKLLMDHLRSHFREDISLEQMAALVNLNPFHLVRLFKRTTGVSPYHYLLILRTEFAKNLLRKGYKVNEAAAAAGFYDTSHFHRLLRKFAGTSPKSFLLSKSQFCTNFIA
ncbi:MAG TPA: AraC family transcriptional regulator [Chitinophagaceae bacterium]